NLTGLLLQPMAHVRIGIAVYSVRDAQPAARAVFGGAIGADIGNGAESAGKCPQNQRGALLASIQLCARRMSVDTVRVFLIFHQSNLVFNLLSIRTMYLLTSTRLVVLSTRSRLTPQRL